MDTMATVLISQACARQRAGIAGKTAPGKCFRLYKGITLLNCSVTLDSESTFKSVMPPTTVPEIQRVDLSKAVLILSALGVNNLSAFDWVIPPSQESLSAASQRLCILQAIDKDGKLTELGKQMVQLPLQPNLSKMLLDPLF
jgi:HrpA-like RNA helicase